MWNKIKNVSKATRQKKGTKKKQEEKKGENEKKEEVPEVDPKETFRQFVFDTIKTVFELVTVNDDININVDNVFPLMKTLEIDGNDETILDMVRTACIETYGNMDTNEFDNAVLDQRRRVIGEEWEEDLKSAFSLIDTDEDGVITTQDIYQLMMGIGEMLTDDELNDIVKAADIDKDGQINYKDFKFFLVGEVDESEEEEEEEEAEKADETKEGEETEKPEEEKKEEPEVKAENAEENQEEKEPETEEERLKREADEKAKQEERMKKRKSLLWGYTQKPVAPPKPVLQEVVKEVVKEVKTKHDSGIGSESESVSEITEDDKTENEEGTGGIISVTVKHLDSITEEKDGEDVFEKSKKDADDDTESRRTPSRKGSARSTRPQSAVTVASSTGVDSIIETDDAEDEIDDIIADELLQPRTSSAKSRVMSARSRLSSRVSSARSARSALSESTDADHDVTADTLVSKVTGEISQITPEVSTLIEESESDSSDSETCLPENDGDTFTGPLSDRQITYVDNFSQTNNYCEVKPKPLFSRVPFVPAKDNKQFPASRFSQFQRTKSASRIHTIKKLEATILRRQNTDSELDLDSVRKANEESRREQRVPGVNGLVCRHITINLNLDSDPASKFTSFSRDFIKRPKTATTYSERRKQIAKERETLREIVDLSDDEHDEEDDHLISIVDLSKSLNKSTGYPENPELPLQHHGYKSVWPLARVKSARNDKINRGKNIELNSISRRLERQELPWRKSQSLPNTSRSYREPHDNKAQAIINLELPLVNRKEPKFKRSSPLASLVKYGQVRG